MAYKPGDNYYKIFVTSNPTTGAAQNADSLPVATATHNGTDDAAFTLTVANMDIGRYLVSGVIPVGYAAGDSVNITVAATVSSVAGKSCIHTFQLDSKRWADVLGASASPLTEGYTTGAFTLEQALYEIAQVVGQNSVSGTTITVQKRDKTTAAATFTLDSSTSPTLRTRAT